MELPDVDDSLPSVTKAYTTMEFPDMDDSIPSVTRAYTGIVFPRVDDFDSLESGGAAYVRLETANVDDYDSLVKLRRKTVIFWSTPVCQIPCRRLHFYQGDSVQCGILSGLIKLY